MTKFVDVMFIIVPILIACGFIFTIISIISPKFRGKMMSRQLKATKYMLDEMKDDLQDMATTMGNVSIKSRENILNQNEDTLRDMATRSANISKEGIRITTEAIKDGILGKKIYCKHCGSYIDYDSKFCKSCGKEQ